MKLQKFWTRRNSSRDSSPSSSSLSNKSRSPMASSDFLKATNIQAHSVEIHSDSSTSSGPTSSSENSPLLPKHIQELHDAFRYFDSNGDGKISMAELGKVLRLLGENPTDEDLESMVKEADADGDGFVCLEEFVSLNTKGLDKMTGVLASVEELKAVFCVFDTDRNGFISAEELHGVLLKLGEHELTVEDCTKMICGVDSDGDGRVDFEEFKRMMTSSC